MATTFFGSQRPIRSRAQIASSEYAVVTIGNKAELGQSIRGQYQRQIQTIFQIGDPSVYWLGGHEQGTLTFQRLVGRGGFFDGWQGDECGVIRPVSIDLGGGPCVAAASGGLKFDGAMIESLEFNMQAGTLEINEGITLRVASMSRG